MHLRNMLLTMTSLLFLGLSFLLAATTTSASNEWASFPGLVSSHEGGSPLGLSSVKKYLNTFGYLPAETTTYDDKFDAAFESALLAYQNRFNLNDSGVLDSATIEQMMVPRCGVPDIVADNSTVDGRNLFSFFPGRPKWPDNSVLRYHFTSTGTTIPQSALAGIFRKAFSRWSAVTFVSFQRVGIVQNADIVIRFFGADHGDGSPFDGRFGTLAHAFSPRNGRLHFDSAEIWAPNLRVLSATTGSFDLLTVAVHEIGHILGLRHSTVKKAVMFPTVGKQTRKDKLNGDDIAGIQVLYGVK